MRSGRPHINSLLVLVHVLLFLASATQYAIVPMLPELSRLHHLTGATTGFLISAPGLATLVVSAPAGLIADRIGAKRTTVVATLMLAAGALAQAWPSLVALLIGRLVFGLAYGLVWTTAVAWLADTHTSSRRAGLGAVAASSAAGMAAGPGIGGIMAQWLGLGAPFVIAGGLAAASAAALLTQPAGRRSETQARATLRAMTRVAPRQPAVLAGAIGLAVVGAAGGVIQLLVPLDLHRAGLSPAATGLVFSVAAGLYVLVSSSIARSGGRLVTVGATALGALALSASLLPALLTAAPAVLVAIVFVTTVPRAMLSTVTYPLATDPEGAGGVPGGAVIGFLNGAWAIGLVVAPLVAGTLQGAGQGVGFLAAAIPGMLGAVWLLTRPVRRPRRLRLIPALRP